FVAFPFRSSGVSKAAHKFWICAALRMRRRLRRILPPSIFEGASAMIVGTAGHIDHGKTALVKALTGVDADRLKEEKARGITIDLGYAYSDLGDGRQLGFVDVPGHERFVHNMLAGAIGIDAALLVVSAAEGIKPQTVEHLQIVDLLGLDRGLVALTKADLADDDQILERMAEVETLLAATL